MVVHVRFTDFNFHDSTCTTHWLSVTRWR